MKLPPELRNKIYKLVATSHHFDRLDRYYYKARNTFLISRNLWDHHTTVQPGIICCSKQTRSEGLAIFFQEHHFHFDLSLHVDYDCLFSKAALKDILNKWLVKLSIKQRHNIRTIKIDCSSIEPYDIPLIRQIHAMLSEKASVTYWVKGSPSERSVQRVVRAFESRNPAGIPIQKIQDPDVDSQVSSLRFLPGQSWFGEGNAEGTKVKGEGTPGNATRVGVQA